MILINKKNGTEKQYQKNNLQWRGVKELAILDMIYLKTFYSIEINLYLIFGDSHHLT